MTEQRTNTRINLINGAIRTVSECGLENTRTKTIAESAGVSEAMLYKHFSSKEELLEVAFLIIDNRVSAIALAYPLGNVTSDNLVACAKELWTRILHYLLDNRDYTLYLLRYRYSSLYTDEVRAKRQAHNGSFENIYEKVHEYFGTPSHNINGFLINYIFEMTLCFAERVLSGRAVFGAECEEIIWGSICGAIGMLTRIQSPVLK